MELVAKPSLKIQEYKEPVDPEEIEEKLCKFLREPEGLREFIENPVRILRAEGIVLSKDGEAALIRSSRAIWQRQDFGHGSTLAITGRRKPDAFMLPAKCGVVMVPGSA